MTAAIEDVEAVDVATLHAERERRRQCPVLDSSAAKLDQQPLQICGAPVKGSIPCLRPGSSRLRPLGFRRPG